jgi:hypothetical protein
MAALLALAAAEPSIIIKWNGMPASWRYGGRLYDAATIDAEWEDQAGRSWYRVESEEGLPFLLGRDANGWVAAPLRPRERKSPGTSAGAGRFLPIA